MGLELAAADHACSVVRRQIQEEFPDLTLVFMVWDESGRQKAFDLKRGELREHPAAEAFMPVLKRTIDKGGAEFSGISIKKPKGLAGLVSKEKVLACFFLNTTRLESSDDARRHAMFLGWQAIALLEDFREGKTDRYEEQGGVLAPKHDKKLRLWKNMLADTFSVLMLEMEKKRDSIGVLGRLRSNLAITARPGSNPERYPFPLVYDATRLVYHDMIRETGGIPSNPVKKALEMTREIGETFDPSTVRQWHNFCKPAQEMAWLGMEPNIILGAAVYNSDDPYARATAYLIAEALNIQTLGTVPPTVYNPFAEVEVNERHHLKACEDNFSRLVAKIAGGSTFVIFSEEIERQNQKMIAGNPLGWCVHALKAAEKSFRDSQTIETVDAVFHEALKEMPWQKVNDVLNLIILLRRDGHEVTREMLVTRLEEVDDIKFLADCFK